MQGKHQGETAFGSIDYAGGIKYSGIVHKQFHLYACSIGTLHYAVGRIGQGKVLDQFEHLE